MTKQYAVIGLGNFGMALARQLAEKGAEVVAVDPDPAQVQLIKDEVAQAVVADATEPQAMAALGVQEMDAALICIRCSISDSLLTVLNLRDLGASSILAMAINEAHGRLLCKLGVDQVLFPERDQANSLTEKLLHPNMIEYLPLVEGYGIIEWQPPPAFLNQPLYELDLINRYGAQVIAVKGSDSHSWQMIPTGQYVTSAGDHLLLLAPHDFLNHVSQEATPRLLQGLWQKPREAVHKLWHKTKSHRQRNSANKTTEPQEEQNKEGAAQKHPQQSTSKTAQIPSLPQTQRPLRATHRPQEEGSPLSVAQACQPPAPSETCAAPAIPSGTFLATPSSQPSFQMAPPTKTTPNTAPEDPDKSDDVQQTASPQESAIPPAKDVPHQEKTSRKSKALHKSEPPDGRLPLWVESNILSPKDLL